jgi:thiamine-phosphate pyrophosphorylase
VTQQEHWRHPARLRARLAVYVLVDGPPQAVAALAGGATAIQLRAKHCSARELCSMGRRLADICAERAALFIVNDRLDVALACGAAGVHLGQDDLPAAEARRIAGPELIIGVSAATPAEAEAASRADADYLGTGSVYATASKADAGKPIGLKGLSRVTRTTALPVVAIGGITPDNAAAAIAAGAAGVAAISAVVGAPDVAAAAARLAAAVHGAIGLAAP